MIFIHSLEVLGARNLSKKRSIEASIKTRTVKPYEDSRQDRVATLASKKIILEQKRQVREARGQRESERERGSTARRRVPVERK